MDLACVRALVRRLDRRDRGTAGAGGSAGGGADIEYVFMPRVVSIFRGCLFTQRCLLEQR